MERLLRCKTALNGELTIKTERSIIEAALFILFAPYSVIDRNL